MSTVRIEVKADLLLWAMEKSDRDIDEIKSKFDIDKWLNKEKKPTFNQLHEFSKFVRIPFGYFMLDSPPVEDIPLLDYRTIATKGVKEASRNLIDTIFDMEKKQAWMREYLIDTGESPLNFVGRFDYQAEVDIKNIAEDIRTELGITKKWFSLPSERSEKLKILKEKCGNIGILVMQNGIVLNNTRRSLNIDEFRAFTLIDDYVPLIFLNTNDTMNGKIFSLLHEVVHVWFGEQSLYNDMYSINEKYYRSHIEVYCNAIAAEILVPNFSFIKMWDDWEKTDDVIWKIEELSDYFKVSNIVIARRALDNLKINETTYYEVVKLTTDRLEKVQRDKESSSGGDYYLTAASKIDRVFFQALTTSVFEGRTLSTEVHKLTGLKRTTFERLVDHVRGEVG